MHVVLQNRSIDLFSLYVLFSHFRPRDATRGNSFFQMSSYARANVRITNAVNKRQIPMWASRGLKWENKTYKLKRSIREMFYNACFSSCSIICKPSSSLRFPLDCLTNDTLDSKVSFLLAGKHVLDRINNDNASFCHAFNGILHGTRHRTAKKNSKEKKGKYAGVVPKLPTFLN